MKSIILSLGLLATLFVSQVSYAQNVREASIQYNKTSQSGVVADFNYPKEALNAVIQKRLNDAKLGKSKTSSKFNMFAGVSWPEISIDKIDVYYKVSGKKNTSTVEFMISKGYDNFINANNDPNAVQNLKNFLASLEQDLKDYMLQNNVKAQEEIVKKAEKVVATSNSNVDKLEKQKINIEKDIEKSKKDLDAAQKALEAEQKTLNSMK